jgi:hypothetical protein
LDLIGSEASTGTEGHQCNAEPREL